MTQTPKPQPLSHRVLGDDTLVVFVSDTHIGGDVGHTIFETPAELCVELWEYPKPAPQHLPVTERLAVLGRLPTPPGEAAPRVYKREMLSGVR